MPIDRMTEHQRKEHDEAYAALKAAGERLMTCAIALAGLPESNMWAGDIIERTKNVQFAIRYYDGHEQRVRADFASRAAEEGGKS